jgi:tetratricopeptide (TPR) repeat protein
MLHRSGPERFDLHELLRQYARERLLELGSFEAASDRHLNYFLAFVEKNETNWQGSDQLSWLDRLERDHDNLRAALEWSLQPDGRPGAKTQAYKEEKACAALNLSGKLYWFWKRRDHWSEGRTWLQRSLAQAKGLPASIEYAKALNAAVLLAVEQADTHFARQLGEENLSISRELGDPFSIACALSSLGLVLWKQKDFNNARAHCEEGLAIFRELNDPFAVADTLHWLGHIAINQDDYESAQTYSGESLSISREMDNQVGIVEALVDLGLLAYLRKDYDLAQSYLEDSLTRFRKADLIPGTVSALNRLGDLARCQGDYEKAGDLYTESMNLYREMGDLDEIPSMLHNLGYIARHRSEYTQAMALFREGLAIQQKMENQAGIAECLLGIAGVLSAQGQMEKGARLLGAAEGLRQSVGASLWPANQVEYDSILASLRASIDKTTLDAAWAAGRAMPIEQAISLANQD